MLSFPWTLSCQKRWILGLFKGVLQVAQYQQVANLEADKVRSRKNCCQLLKRLAWFSVRTDFEFCSDLVCRILRCPFWKVFSPFTTCFMFNDLEVLLRYFIFAQKDPFLHHKWSKSRFILQSTVLYLTWTYAMCRLICI